MSAMGLMLISAGSNVVSCDLVMWVNFLFSMVSGLTGSDIQPQDT